MNIMKNVIHHLLIPIAFVFIPFLWLAFILCGYYVSFNELYLELIEYVKSGESFGMFDT